MPKVRSIAQKILDCLDANKDIVGSMFGITLCLWVGEYILIELDSNEHIYIVYKHRDARAYAIAIYHLLRAHVIKEQITINMLTVIDPSDIALTHEELR